jgi:hypothetical protein
MPEFRIIQNGTLQLCYPDYELTEFGILGQTMDLTKATDRTNNRRREWRRQRGAAPRDRVRLSNGLSLCARAVGIEVDKSVRQRLLALSEDEFRAILLQLVGEMESILRGDMRAAVVSIDTQLENFRLWQFSKGAEYYRWTDAAMAALRRKLVEIGEGNFELIPTFAMSVQIKLLPSGKFILVGRNGQEVES